MRSQVIVKCLGSLAVSAMLLTACGESPGDPKASGRKGDAAGKATVADFALATAPADARDVADVKAHATKGDEVVMRGVIGGRAKPFLDKVAVVTVVDANFKGPCTGGMCKQPWDYCCSDKTALTAAMATIQVVGQDGRPLPGTLQGVAGLEPLTLVTVRGTVADVEPGKQLVVNATAAHVQPYKPKE